MKRLTLLLTLLCALTATLDTDARTRKKRPEPRPATIDIITRVNDYWQQHHTPLVRAFWDEAAYHTGNMEAYRLLGHARWLDYSTRWAQHNLWQGARQKDPAKWRYKNYGEGHDYVLFGDWQICFQTYLDLYALNPDHYKIARAIEVIDTEVRSTATDYWWWADALYMVMPVFTKLYKTTGDQKYLDKLYDNYRWADELMYDTVAHLYFRDAKYIYPKAKTRSGGKDFWARGDGWVLAGLAKVLADMPADYRHRPFFELRFRQLAQAVAACQQPEGYWTRSMLDKDHAEGPETSGTAFFCYGLLWGVNHGLLAHDDYAPVISRAWDYLTLRALQPTGAVGFVQPIGERAIPGQQLSERNEANFGVGAFLLAACEHLRYEERYTPHNDTVVRLTVSNNAAAYRHHVVELDAAAVCERLAIQGGRQFIVCDEAGLEVPYQLTHDGHLLIEADATPASQTHFTIRRGQPRDYHTVCYGRLYPERKDDYAWENDRGAYRVYGPALQRSGERSYGTDVWSKNTPDLVVEQRYWTEDVVMMPAVERLRKADRQRGDSLYRLNSYHHDHGRGMDLYKVGATLGCGTPALLDDRQQIVYPYCFASYSVLDNGPLRTTVELVYQPTVFRGDTITEHRRVTLDKGSNFNRITVWYDGLTKPAQLAAGVAIHTEDTLSVVLGPDYVQYADPTENPRYHHCQLFVATLFPEATSQLNTPLSNRRGAGGEASVTTRQLPLDTPRSGCVGHALGIVDGYAGAPYTYYAGSAWSRYDVRTQAEWQQRIDWTLDQLRHPLTVEIK